MTHTRPRACEGEFCRMCARDAMHKVGEEILDDDRNPQRHNLTAYVCCECFGEIFGPSAIAMCLRLASADKP